MSCLPVAAPLRSLIRASLTQQMTHVNLIKKTETEPFLPPLPLSPFHLIPRPAKEFVLNLVGSRKPEQGGHLSQ